MVFDIHNGRGETLADALKSAGAYVSQPCGGRGVCGKCRVRAHGALSPVSEREAALFSPAELADGYRLACLTRIYGDAHVETDTAPEMRVQQSFSGMRAQTEGALPEDTLAVDIGTTTIAAYRVSAKNGAVVNSACAENPQRAFGADVISRVGRALSGDADALANAVRTCVDTLAARLHPSVRRMVICGNTAMMYLLDKVSVQPLAGAPFVIDNYMDVQMPASRWFSRLPADCAVYLPRCVSAFVGADITCAMLATNLCESSKPAMLLDVGTNGEIALFTGSELVCCSTAAGPAFEGAGISMGGAARDGAIDRVRVENGTLVCHVLGDSTATHICGSGLMDAVAALLSLDALQPGGRLDTERLHALGLLDGQSVCLKDGVRLTQADIRAVQLAKAAVCAGALTLLDHAGLRAEDIGRVELAGGFGTRMNIQSAAQIGLLPPALALRAHAVGNAAGAGAVLLTSEARREEASALAKRARTIELSADPCFMNHYVNQMAFGDMGNEEEDE